MKNRLFAILLLCLPVLVKLQGQGLTCATSEPFCTGTIYEFPAGTTGYAEPGANYGCLSTQPAPAWYHMLVDNPGSITIYMFSTPLEDIDFICWGPYTDPWAPCVFGLTGNKIVDCSYSPDPTEYCDIPNAQTGEYYILLITNFSQDPCNITFSQTGGNGSTDCTILPPLVSNNGPLCVGETLHLYAETFPNATYNWSGPNGFISNLQNPVIPNVTMANAGNYSCVITVNGQSSDPAITTVNIYELPIATMVSPDTTICVGTAAHARFSLTGWGPFQIEYNDGTNTYISPNLYGPSDTIFLYPDSPTEYTFTKVTDSHCDRPLIFSDIIVDTYPFTSGVLSGSGTICAGEPAQITFTLTGAPPWTIIYTGNGSNPQTITANASPHVITLYPTVQTLYEFVSLEDMNCTGEISGQAQISVSPSPTANAGMDQTIPYGTTTVLQGQAGGGSGDYNFSWTPANKLVNPNVAQPTTINLTETTLFTLTVTDNNGYCQDHDDAWVNISGGPLNCNPTASPNEICHNLTSQLYATAGGGSGEYSYTWTSIPPGFNSMIPSPVVNPDQNTTYYVSVSDGYNTVSGNVTVTVNPRPVPYAGNDQIIPHGTSTQLSGSGSGGSGSHSYHWEPASKLLNPLVPDPVTVNLYTTTLFTLTVTDMASGCASENPAQVTVIISGDALSANPVAEPDEICQGHSTTLHALAGGGSGQYTYSWTSDPPGFSSTSADPVVNPGQSTLYTVTISDGFNNATGYVNVTVLEVPEIDLGPQTLTVCVYDTITLDAGNPGSAYLWNNGSTEQRIEVATTGIGFDLQTHTVLVTSPSGCQSEDSITIVFDFSACSGIDDVPEDPAAYIYPNPGNGNLYVVFRKDIRMAEVSVINFLGQTVDGTAVKYLKGPNDPELLLNMAHLSDGLYFVRVDTEGHSRQIFKYLLRK